MGRELRRVPVDFDWPLYKTWRGFLMPESLRLPHCPDCANGYGPEANALAESFYPHMVGGNEKAAWHDKLVQADVDALIREDRVPAGSTAAEINANQRRGGLTSHDAINRMILVEDRCKRLGIDLPCPTCKGEGDVGTSEQRRAFESWEREDPPVGDGWQIWETVSEGSPISPVFATREELVAWMQESHRSWGAMSKDGAEAFCDAGWAISIVGVPGVGVMTGTEFIDRKACEDQS